MPIVTEYCYLGVTVDDRGGLQQHLERVKQRSSYLRSQMRYYMRNLSFENQYLLWAVYVRPYFTYIASLLKTQMRRQFHSAWRQSFKLFMGLPSGMRSTVLQTILHNSDETCSEAAERNAEKIARRFGIDALVAIPVAERHEDVQD